MTDTTGIKYEFGIAGKTPDGNQWLKKISGTF